MKAVALILALAVITGRCIVLHCYILFFLLYSTLHIYPSFISRVPITGCNGQWEKRVKNFEEVIVNLMEHADGIVHNITASDFRRELE